MAYEWHLQRSLPAMVSLVRLPFSGVSLVSPTDFGWIDAALRFLTLHLCLGTEPLAQRESLRLFLHHLLLLAHPVPLRLFPVERRACRGSGEDSLSFEWRRGASMASSASAGGPATFAAGASWPRETSLARLGSLDTLHSGGPPRNLYVSLAAAVTKVVVRCCDSRRWVSDRGLLAQGFRLHEKLSAGSCTVAVYIQRRSTAEPFTPPLRALRSYTVVNCGTDGIVTPFRSSRIGVGIKIFTFSGGVLLQRFFFFCCCCLCSSCCCCRSSCWC